jgi:predicted porin
VKRTHLALSIASALAASTAAAQTSNVTLYGRANLAIDNFAATGASVPASGIDPNLKARWRVSDSASRLGVRGVEDLGNGLRAIFQIETGVNVDNGAGTGQGGQVNANANGALASRDSFVGLEGGFGRLTLGRQSVFWVNGTIIQTGANYVNAEVPFLNGAILGRVVSGMARNPNVVLYTSPTFGGFNATLGWAPLAEATQGQTAATPPGSDANKTNSNLYGVTARWAGGPFAVQGDYWVNDAATGQRNTFVGVSSTKFTAMKVLGGWRYMPGAQISLVAGRNKNDASSQFSIGTFGVAGFAAANVKQDWFGVSWEHTFGNIQALAQYGRIRDAKGCLGTGGAPTCTDTGGSGVMVGGRYLFSKRTAAYITYNKVTNKTNNNNDYIGGAVTSANPGLPLGADPRIVAVGMIHNF